MQANFSPGRFQAVSLSAAEAPAESEHEVGGVVETVETIADLQEGMPAHIRLQRRHLVENSELPLI